MKKVEDVIRKFEQLCKKSLGKELVALYLRGSYSRGDWVPGLSDFDFYVILYESNSKSEVKQKLEIILKELREAYPEHEYSLRYDVEFDVIASGCDGYITRKDSKLLLGRDVLGKIPPPSLDELKDYGKKMVIRLCDDWMEAEKIRKVPQSLEDAANGAQYMVLKIAQNALFIKGLLVFYKKDIVNAFKREYSDSHLVNSVLEAYDMRTKWGIVRHDRARLKIFVENALTFSQAFKKYIVTC